MLRHRPAAARTAGARPVGAVPVGAVLAGAVLAGITAVVGCRVAGTDAVTPVPQLLSFLPWLIVPTVVCLVVALAARCRVLAGWAAVLLAVTAWYGRPYGPGATPADGRPVAAPLRVLAANVEFGGATRELLRVIHRERPDLVFVTECDPACVRTLGTAYPHRAQVAGEGSTGSVILSAHPLTPGPALPSLMGMPGATARIAGREVRLRLAHPMPPLPGQDGVWKRELGLLRDDAARHARGGPLLVAGDFNATQDHAAFRAVLDAGALHDAARLAGAFRTPSWPQGAGLLPPYAQIDHVLVGGDDLSVRGARFLDLPGTDHRALLADLDLHTRR
ncbi:endonuclease/exonuclease/phosphatase family protein [Streptomyces sp. NPDC093595]|uniref:endonuclease/exonuclease/phosphatase family protein n=1 Tax=Streptomyces sp. NPDC093595 TaxID=3366045 RepID=UPI0038263966